MNSLITSTLLLASLTVPAPPPVGNNGVHPGIGPDIHRPTNVPRQLQPDVNGVRPGVGPDVLRPQRPTERTESPSPHRAPEPRSPRPPKPDARPKPQSPCTS